MFRRDDKRIPGLMTAILLLTAVMTGPAMGQASTSPADVPQSDPVGALLRRDQASVAARPTHPLDPEDVRTTQALNAEIASRNDLATQQEDADQAAYQAALERNAAQVEADRVQAEADRQSREATARDQDARYQKALADWQATVAACQRGDRARCRAGQTVATPR